MSQIILIVLGVLGGGFLLIYLITLIIGGIYGVVYLPTPRKSVEKMVRLAKIHEKSAIIDVGSGDGRFVIAGLRAGAKRGTGIEVSWPLALWSRWKISRAGVGERASIVCANMWHQKELIAEHDVIFLFVLPEMMDQFFREVWPLLKPGTQVVSHVFRPKKNHNVPESEEHQVPGEKQKVYVWRK